MVLIVALDTETTGFEAREGHRFVEVCLRVYELETRKLRLNFVQRINPERSIPAAAAAVHGITLNELVGKPTWDRVAPSVSAILRKCQVAVAHNAKFDMPFIAHELARVGQPVPNIEVFCTMENALWATPHGKLPNLGELAFACDIDYDPSQAHAAEYDTEIMIQCLWRGLDWGVFDLGLEASKVAA